MRLRLYSAQLGFGFGLSLAKLVCCAPLVWIFFIRGGGTKVSIGGSSKMLGCGKAAPILDSPVYDSVSWVDVVGSTKS